MGLTSSGHGWAFTGEKLYVTGNGGDAWRDVTPPHEKVDFLYSACFSDSLHGSAFINSHPDDGDGSDSDSPPVRPGELWVVNTADGGVTWGARVPLPVPQTFPEDSQLGGNVEMSFGDVSHGWILMWGGQPRGTYLGYKTEDGGQTWHFCSFGTLGDISFVSATKGWVVGGDDIHSEIGIFQTDDGGETWRRLNFPSVDPGADLEFSTNPIVIGPDHFAVLTIAEPGTKRYVFESSDGGKSWQTSYEVQGQGLTAIVAGTSDVRAISSDLAMRRWKAGRMLEEIRPVLTPKTRTPVIAAEFISAREGWIGSSLNVRNDKPLLLGTTDGGASWKDITPTEVPSPSRRMLLPKAAGTTGEQKVAQPLARGLAQKIRPNDEGDAPAPTVVTTQLLMFDRTRVLTVDQMQNWWNLSPYYGFALYLSGSPNRGNDRNLNAAWVNSIQQQGWGLASYWFGLQSACGCFRESKDGSGTCLERFATQISSDTATAYTQGMTAATDAQHSASVAVLR